MGLKNPNLTSDLSDPIERRAADTVAGQATWVDPSFQNQCGACRHFPLDKQGKATGKRVCTLTREMMKPTIPRALPFNTWACSYFEKRQPKEGGGE